MNTLIQIPYNKIIPTLSTLERDALIGMKIGYEIFNSDYSNVDKWDGTEWVGFRQIRYVDEMPSGIWVTPAGSTAPDDVTVTIGGIQFKGKAFNGSGTTELMSNQFEINHNTAVDLINAGTVEEEVHVHMMPSTNDAGVAVFQFEYTYIPFNEAPIVCTPILLKVDIAINQQYFNLLKGEYIPIPAGGFHIGDIILFNLKRDPTHIDDSYEHDAILLQCAMHVPVDNRGSRHR
jgi:hypothetical protein